MNEQGISNKFGVPVSKTSPKERIRELMAMRNEWKLYRRKCDATGKDIISAYAADAPFTIYKNDIWWGDTWDATQYGRDFDFTRPFFEQFAELQKVVPREGTSVFNSENCDYNGHVRNSRNCYLNGLAANCEDLLYSYWMVNTKDTADSIFTNNSTLCYECTHGENLYDCIMVEESNGVSESYFCYQMKGCDHTMFSANLNNKSYYLFNEPCTKEEFEVAKKKYINGSYQAFQEGVRQFEEIKSQTIRRATNNVNCEDCAGDHMLNSRNCSDGYEVKDSEDVYNTVSAANSKDIYSSYSAGWPACEEIYYCSTTRGSMKCKFCYYCWTSSDLTYCENCVSSKDSFGCIGLRQKKYCILNKQYAKEEYEALVPRIIEHMKNTGEWGEYFPHSLSSFAYNETSANNFFPLTKEEAIHRGWRWKDEEKQEFLPASVTSIPDKIAEVNSSITKEVLACQNCKRNYKIVPQELAFYQKQSLPVPHYCHICRHMRRLSLENPMELFDGHCNKCNAVIKTTYKPGHKEIVYCEKCYLEAVY